MSHLPTVEELLANLDAPDEPLFQQLIRAGEQHVRAELDQQQAKIAAYREKLLLSGRLYQALAQAKLTTPANARETDRYFRLTVRFWRDGVSAVEMAAAINGIPGFKALDPYHDTASDVKVYWR